MRALISIIFVLFALSGTRVLAATYSFSTPVNSLVAGSPVSAHVTFQVSAGSLYVTLVNLEPGTVSVGQNISSIFFTVNNGASILSLSSADLSGSSGTEVTIGAGGVVSGVQAVSPVTHWAAGSSAGQSFLDDLAGGGSPIHTIIGPASSGGSYSTVNASIAGNGPHNPFIQQQAVFAFNNPGLLATSSISNVSIGFGTTAGNTVHTIPEPDSLLLTAGGLLATAMLSRYRVWRIPRSPAAANPYPAGRGSLECFQTACFRLAAMKSSRSPSSTA